MLSLQKKTSLLTELSLCDCYLSDIYHLLENIDFPASEYFLFDERIKGYIKRAQTYKKIILRKSK